MIENSGTVMVPPLWPRLYTGGNLVVDQGIVEIKSKPIFAKTTFRRKPASIWRSYRC